MDYKELIEDLRHAVDLICVSDLYVSCENELRDAATAIEALSRQVDDLQTLLDMYGGEEGITAAFQKAAERDAAVEELRGICWCCVHGKPWEKAGPLSKLAGCEYLSEIGVLARGGGRCKCSHWEWRGLKKGDGEGG